MFSPAIAYEVIPPTVVITPMLFILHIGSARIEKKGSRRKGTSKGEIEPPPKRRRTEPLKQIRRTGIRILSSILHV